MRVILNRIYEQKDLQTKGELYILNDSHEEIFRCKTLELPWRDNKKRISCIPDGSYKCVKRISKKYGHHWHILEVPNRSLILIHHGNYNKDTLGCILVGEDFVDINNDGLCDVTSSVTTMNRLRKILEDEFTIEIRKYRDFTLRSKKSKLDK